MFVTLRGKIYTVNSYVFQAIYPFKEDSGKFESQFQWILKFSSKVGSTFNECPGVYSSHYGTCSSHLFHNSRGIIKSKLCEVDRLNP